MKVALVLEALCHRFCRATLAEVVFSYALLPCSRTGPKRQSWRPARMAASCSDAAIVLVRVGKHSLYACRYLMLGKMVGVKELGLYSAAVRLSMFGICTCLTATSCSPL